MKSNSRKGRSHFFHKRAQPYRLFQITGDRARRSFVIVIIVLKSSHSLKGQFNESNGHEGCSERLLECFTCDHCQRLTLKQVKEFSALSKGLSS